MADVATLGLAVDSSQVKSATADLNRFNAASATASNAVQRLKYSSGQLGPTMQSVAAMAKRAGISTDEMAAKLNANHLAAQKLNAASQTAVKGMQSLSEQSRRSANDNQELGKQTDKARGSLETFASRFTRGLIAGIAITAVRDLTRTVLALNAALAATADTAQRVSIGGQQFQGLQTAAAYKGIGNADFNSSMLSFNQQVSLARNGLGTLQTLLSSNGKTVSDTATTFGVIADLVKRASGDTARQFSILQQAGLPATTEYIRLMEQGSSAIQKQADASSKLSDQQLADAKKINDKWNEYWTNFENWGKRAVVNVIDAMRGIQTNIPQQIPQSGNPTRITVYASPQEKDNTPPKPVFDPELAKQQIALEQQRLGLLSPLATAQDVVRAKQLEINAAALNNVNISKQQADALKLVTLAQFEMNRVNQQAQIGVFNLDAANKAAQDTLKAWVAQKLLDPANEQQMAAARTMLAKSTEQLADAAKVASAPLEGLQRLINEGSNLRGVLDQGVVSGLNSVENALVDITSGTVTAADGFKNLSQSVIRSIEQMIIKMTIITPMAKALQAALGAFGIGGGSINLGGPGGPVPFANALGNVFPANDNGISRFSSQVVSKPTMFAFANGVGLMGEAGAEAIMPLQRGPDGKLGVRAAGGGGMPVINIINQTSGQVEQGGVKQNADGSIDVVIRNAVTGVLVDDAAKNGPISKAFAARQAGFGAR